MPTLAPPDDESIKTLYVGGLDARITEQDLRDHFYAHGEIESIRMVLQRACAFVTYTTREGAEKAAEELSNKLVIKGLRLKLMWGKPQAPRPEGEVSTDDEAARQGLVAHAGLLPRAVISQQQGGGQQPPQPQPPGTQYYFNIPPPPPPERTFYPSMDPQRMGALVPNSQEGGDSKSGSERQPRAPDGQGHSYPGGPPPYLPGQYPPYYQPYGYMGQHPPAYHQQYPPYQQQMMAPQQPPQPQSAATQQQYQGPGTSAANQQQYQGPSTSGPPS